MRLRSVLILLIAAAFLGWALRPHRSNRLHQRRSPGAAVVASVSGTNGPASHSGTFRHLAPWRHRIKFVLEVRHAIGIQAVARGPASILDPHHRPVDVDRPASVSMPLIARRC